MRDEDRRKCEAALARIREAECDICEVAVQRVRDEKRNFGHLDAWHGYSDDRYHKKAVTHYSFEELAKAMGYLANVQEFRVEAIELSRLAMHELSRPADERNATEVFALIEELEPRLAKYTQTVCDGHREKTSYTW